MRILIPFGFNNQTIGTLECLDEIEKSSKLLLSEYFDNKLSARLIFEKYNCEKYFKSEWYIRYFIKTKFDINLRTTSEAVTNAIELGLYDNINIKQNLYKVETHTTWDYKTITLRSSYEIDYASELDELKISYDYEILRIRYFDTKLNRERIAIPDFYLIDTNTIVEVKSSWTLDKQNMLDKRKAYLELGYNFKLWYEHEYVELDDLEFNDNNIDNYR